MPTLSESCLQQDDNYIFSEHLRTMCVAIIACDILHQMSHEVLGHYTIRNVTKFSKPVDLIIDFFLTKNHLENILKKTIPHNVH